MQQSLPKISDSFDIGINHPLVPSSVVLVTQEGINAWLFQFLVSSRPLLPQLWEDKGWMVLTLGKENPQQAGAGKSYLALESFEKWVKKYSCYPGMGVSQAERVWPGREAPQWLCLLCCAELAQEPQPLGSPHFKFQYSSIRVLSSPSLSNPSCNFIYLMLTTSPIGKCKFHKSKICFVY